MRRLTIAPEHKKFFHLNGFITFEELVSSTVMEALYNEIQAHREELPGRRPENLFRSLPTVRTLVHKISAVAAALIDRKPIRVAYDCFLEKLDELPEIEEREVGLLLSLKGRGLFFTERSQLYNEKEPCYLLIIFTANYVNNPIVFK